jgi:hypothetical protein
MENKENKEDKENTYYNNLKYDIHINKTHKENILAMSGGGTYATVFSMGAIKCLNDFKILENINLYSSVSGSTITQQFIESNTYNNVFYYDTFKSNIYSFFEKCVYVKILYKLLNPLSWFNLNETIFSTIENNINLKETSPNDKFLYNYIDLKTFKPSQDHTDIYNDKYFHEKRIFRCTNIFEFFNNQGSMDLGYIDNNGLITLLNKYDFNNLYVITVQTNDIINNLTWYQYIKLILFNSIPLFVNLSNYNSIIASLEIINSRKKLQNLVLIKPSNPNYSKCPYINKIYKDTFSNFFVDIVSKDMYNGITHLNIDMLKIIENLGYLESLRKLSKLHNKEIDDSYIKANLPNNDDKYMDNNFVKSIYEKSFNKK